MTKKVQANEKEVLDLLRCWDYYVAPLDQKKLVKEKEIKKQDVY